MRLRFVRPRHAVLIGEPRKSVDVANAAAKWTSRLPDLVQQHCFLVHSAQVAIQFTSPSLKTPEAITNGCFVDPKPDVVGSRDGQL